MWPVVDSVHWQKQIWRRQGRRCRSIATWLRRPHPHDRTRRNRVNRIQTDYFIKTNTMFHDISQSILISTGSYEQVDSIPHRSNRWVRMRWRLESVRWTWANESAAKVHEHMSTVESRAAIFVDESCSLTHMSLGCPTGTMNHSRYGGRSVLYRFWWISNIRY
jgi:hypothetical protein